MTSRENDLLVAKHNLLRQSVQWWEKTDFVRTPDSKAKASSD